MAEEKDPLLGRRLGRCVFEQRLGAGAMGVVYRARHDAHGAVCVKLIKPDQLRQRSELMLRRFRREAAAAQRLDHENVVRAYGLEEANGHLMLVQELVCGGDLVAYRVPRRRHPDAATTAVAVRAPSRAPWGSDRATRSGGRLSPSLCWARHERSASLRFLATTPIGNPSS